MNERITRLGFPTLAIAVIFAMIGGHAHAQQILLPTSPAEVPEPAPPRGKARTP